MMPSVLVDFVKLVTLDQTKWFLGEGWKERGKIPVHIGLICQPEGS